MAKDPATKPSRDGKSGAAAGKKGRKREKGQRFEKLKQIGMAYKITRQRDKALPLWMAIAFFGAFAVVLLIMILVGFPIFFGLPTAILVGVLALMIVFGRRVQKAAFSQVEGERGASIWVLQNLRGDWRLTQAVQVNSQFDAVHRVLGRPGVILVAEGQPQRVRSMLAQEKKRVSRIAGDTPIYDVLVGDEDGEVSLRKLNQHMLKLPRNLDQRQVNALEKRLAALGGTKSAPLPKGPMPSQARMSGMQRTLRRR
jgi:Domain of unknown function (DUF4191)